MWLSDFGAQKIVFSQTLILYGDQSFFYKKFKDNVYNWIQKTCG